MSDTQITQDKALIDSLGGPSKVAKLIGCNSPQVVHNWTTRGIPAAVKLAHPRIFLKKPRKPSKTEA